MLPLPGPPPPSPLTGFGRILERLSSLFEVVLVAFLGSFIVQGVLAGAGLSPMTGAPELAAFMWSEAVLTVVILTVLLRVRGEGWKTLGWTSEGFHRESRIGLLVLPGLFAVTIIVGYLFHTLWPQYVSERNDLLDMIRTRQDLALFLISSIFVGGFKEEIQRAFILKRFERDLGGIWVGLLVWTPLFGALHYVQGVDKAFGAGVLGLFFGLLFIWRRKLTSPIVSHALYDVTTLLLFWSLLRNR
ncbi:MAG: CPBP family intramembrane metalloprotease [Acidobacteria bacterium]|nr:MAG: CPBP family intramembrane metalloprotease [Acidobacteriota bacterium]